MSVRAGRPGRPGAVAASAGRRERDPRRRVVAVCAGTGCRAQGALERGRRAPRRGRGARSRRRARGARHRLPRLLRARPARGPAAGGHRLPARRGRRRRRDRGADPARRRGRAAAVHRRRVGAGLPHRAGDPLLPRPAAPAAGRQRPARPHVHRRLHRARRLRGPRQGPRDGPRGGARGGQALGPARTRRRRLPDGPQVGGVPQGRGRPQVRGLQRRRGRPRRVHGRALLEGNPHSVLEGMLIGAYAMGAREGHVYVRQEYPARRRARHARDRAGSGGRPARRVHPRQRPLVRPPGQPRRRRLRLRRGQRDDGLARGPARRAAPALIHLSERGLWGRPTNLNNVETWANVPQIVLQRRRLVPRHRHRGLHGHQDLLARRQGEQHRARRGPHGHHAARDRLRRRRRDPGGQEVQGRPDRRPVRRLPARPPSSTCRWTSTRSWPRAR